MSKQIYLEYQAIDSKTGMFMAAILPIEMIESIDYGNYGTEQDRHYEPHLHPVGWPRPVLIIRVKDGKAYSTSRIRFTHF